MAYNPYQNYQGFLGNTSYSPQGAYSSGYLQPLGNPNDTRFTRRSNTPGTFSLEAAPGGPEAAAEPKALDLTSIFEALRLQPQASMQTTGQRPVTGPTPVAGILPQTGPFITK